MAALPINNMSDDLMWEIVRNNHCFLSKSNQNGGVQFSHDPLNLVGKNSRKHAGFVNTKAIGIIPSENGGMTVISKKASAGSKPKQAFVKNNLGAGRSSRKTYKSVAAQTAGTGYRADLRQHAVERVSAIRRSQRPVKPSPEPKLRGNAAKRAAAEEA